MMVLAIGTFWLILGLFLSVEGFRAIEKIVVARDAAFSLAVLRSHKLLLLVRRLYLALVWVIIIHGGIFAWRHEAVDVFITSRIPAIISGIGLVLFTVHFLSRREIIRVILISIRRVQHRHG